MHYEFNLVIGLGTRFVMLVGQSISSSEAIHLVREYPQGTGLISSSNDTISRDAR
jgi:hypothetical protein